MALSDLSPSTRGGCHDKTGGITIHNINTSVKYITTALKDCIITNLRPNNTL